MKVYIVWGDTGVYDDRSIWIAKIFKNKTKAESFRLECQKYADYMMEDIPDEQGLTMPRYYAEEYNGPDERFRIDYTGTDYTVFEDEVEV